MDAVCIVCNSNDVKLTVNGIRYCKECLDKEREEYFKYERSRTKLFPEINEIINDKLYLGNYDQAKDLNTLKKFKISHILMCGTFLEKMFPDSFVYEHFEIEDTIEENISKFFKRGIEFIENSDVVFVHCHAGVSRSASIVIAYIMHKFKIGYEDAYKIVKNKRREIFPNESFRNQLREFEKDIL